MSNYAATTGRSIPLKAGIRSNRAYSISEPSVVREFSRCLLSSLVFLLPSVMSVAGGHLASMPIDGAYCFDFY